DVTDILYEDFVEALEDEDRHLEAREAFKQFVCSTFKTRKYTKTCWIAEKHRQIRLNRKHLHNGHELQVLVYNSSRRKPPSTTMPNTTRAKLADARELFASEELLLSEKYVTVCIDPDICNTAKAAILDTRTSRQLKNVSVSQGSHGHATKTFMEGLNKPRRN
ncbi:hypothetical protein BGX28_001087, partial [Mortierella sp. GBA30]